MSAIVWQLHFRDGRAKAAERRDGVVGGAEERRVQVRVVREPVAGVGDAKALEPEPDLWRRGGAEVGDGVESKGGLGDACGDEADVVEACGTAGRPLA